MAMRPSGSMSQSGYWPGFTCACQTSQRQNISSKDGQLSQKSSVIRHMLACFAMCHASLITAGPGERLSTMPRPQRSIAVRIISISRRAEYSSSGVAFTLQMSSTLT